MAWLLNQQYMRENLKLGPGGETGPVNDLVRSTTERIGANIMGKLLIVQLLRTCAICVSESGLTTGCSGRSAARPAAEPERWAAIRDQ
jgi:hypothetical protein